MAKILILAALAEEADAVFPDSESRAAYAHGFACRQLIAAGHELAIVTTGLGKVNAALAAGLFGAEADLWLMTGTCGALDARAGAYWIAEAVQHDYGTATNDGFRRYRAGEWPLGKAGALSFAAMPDAGLGLPHARIATGDNFVADAAAAAAMRDALNVQLVDMEVAAVAQAADRCGRPWGAIKAVTDEADGASSDDFHANLRRAALQAAEAIERLVAIWPGPSGSDEGQSLESAVALD